MPAGRARHHQQSWPHHQRALPRDALPAPQGRPERHFLQLRLHRLTHGFQAVIFVASLAFLVANSAFLALSSAFSGLELTDLHGKSHTMTSSSPRVLSGGLPSAPLLQP